MKKTLGKIILDLIPVAIGVYVGLLVSNWNEDKKTQELTIQTIERIEKEVLANQKRIQDVKAYHLMVRDTIQKIELPELPSDQDIFKFWKGINMPRLQKSTFETAFQTGISSNINITLLEQLNALYASQDAYNEFSNTASQSLYNIDFSKKESTQRMLIFISMIMSDIYYFENSLAKQFDASLKAIDNLQ